MPTLPTEESNASSGEHPEFPEIQTVTMAEYNKLKSQYNGLNGFATQEKNKRLELEAQITSLTQKYEGDVVTLSSQFDTTAKELAATRAQVEELTGKLSAAQRHQEVSGLIAQQFPALSKAQSAGLLRTDGLEGEELTNYLSGMNELIDTTKEKFVNDAMKGTVPPTPGGAAEATLTSDQMYDRLMSMNPNTKEYAALNKAYQQSLG